MTTKTSKTCTSLLHCLTLLGKCPLIPCSALASSLLHIWNIQDTLPPQGTVLCLEQPLLDVWIAFSYLLSSNITYSKTPFLAYFLKEVAGESTILHQEVLLCSWLYFSTPPPTSASYSSLIPQISIQSLFPQKNYHWVDQIPLLHPLLSHPCPSLYLSCGHVIFNID